MRKATVFCMILAVLSAALLAGAAIALDQRKNDVAVEEIFLSGDPSAADGLVLRTRLWLDHDQDNVWWEWEHRFGAEPAHSASFRFAAFPPHRALDPSYSGLTLCAPGFYNSVDGDWTANAMYEDVAGRAARSTDGEYTERVALADYFDALPISFDLSFPDSTLDFTTNAAYGGSGTALYRRLNEVFRISVTEDMTATITVGTDESGRLSYWSLESSSLIESVSVPAANGIYFAISPRPAGQPALDLSEIELGYGVYYLPMIPSAHQKGSVVPDPDGLCLALPLDPDAVDTVEEIVYQAEHDRLFLLTRKDGLYTLTAVRESTREVLSMLTLTSPGRGRFASMRYEDGFLVALFRDSWFSVIAEGENGYAPVFSTINYREYLDPETTNMAFDGKRLAVFGSYELSVFNANGLQFQAYYFPFHQNMFLGHLESSDCVMEWEGTP